MPVAVYAQLGMGFAFNSTSLTINSTVQGANGTKLLFQYGGGIRARPLIFEFNGGALRVSFRFELTRFRRGYMDDTFVGGGAGVTF